MHISHTKLVAALSASLAAGSAIPQAAQPGSFQVKQRSNTEFAGRNGPLALARAYEKYGIPVPDSLRAAAETNHAALFKRQSGSVVATPKNNDLEYTVPVEIGSPPQTLDLQLDTGSSDLWVYTVDSPSLNGTTHKRYNPAESSTSEMLSGSTWSVSYGDGTSSSGDVYNDTVSIGGLTVEAQAVEAALNPSPEIAKKSDDGILGLAMSGRNGVIPQKQKTWFDNVSSQLASALFVADLKHNAAGTYTFGAIPPEVKDISYAPLDQSLGFWQFNTSTDFGDISAIADTGSSFILTHDYIVQDYYSQVEGVSRDTVLGGYSFDCNTTLPDFWFTAGDGEIAVPGSLINYGPIASEPHTCYGGIQSIGNNPFSVFGDIAFKAAYVVFDGGNSQVGWAQKQTV